MLDIKFIRANEQAVKQAIKNKGIDLDLALMLSTHDQVAKINQEIQSLNQQRNELSEKVKESKGKPDAKTISQGKEIKTKLETLEKKLKPLAEKLKQQMLLIPNVYSADTPVAKDETGNQELYKKGKVPKFDFTPKSHIELAELHNLADFDRGTKVSGFRGYYLKNELALMHWGLMQLALQKMVKHDFQIMVTPTMVRELALTGSGHFPAGQAEIYPVKENDESEGKFLAGTSEPSLLAYRADEIVDLKELPLKYCGISPCYRREVGSYGKDAKGLYRVHEFFKVEQVVVCEAKMETGQQWFEKMLAIAEELLIDLGLPYRVIQICTGDMGAGKYKMYDIETWMPSRGAYSETHSLSFLTDWQSRRLNLRYRNEEGEMVYPYTLNNTVIASPRILIALLENFQQADGSIKIPKILIPFIGKNSIK